MVGITSNVSWPINRRRLAYILVVAALVVWKSKHAATTTYDVATLDGLLVTSAYVSPTYE